MSKVNLHTNKVNEYNKLTLWNANSIRNKIDEIFLALLKEEIDILAINETKLEKDKELFSVNNDQYNYRFKSRNKYGGGVGFIIRKNIEFEIIKDLDDYNTESACIKLKYKEKDLFIITYYNYPNAKINIDMFEFIDRNFENYIICGDFNSKHKSFGCKINNLNGIALNEFINNSNSIILNKKHEFTFHKEQNGYKELLDLMICSSNLYSEIFDCFVNYDSILYSDHLPINLIFKKNSRSSYYKKIKDQSNDRHRFNYNRANWNKYKSELEIINVENILKSNNTNEINEFCISSILSAAKKSIPMSNSFNQNSINPRLPKYIIELINKRRKIKRRLLKSVDEKLNKEFLIICKTIREEIKAYKNKKMNNFVNNFNKNPLSSKPFWKKINVLKNNGQQKDQSYPILLHDDKEITEDYDKANLFGSLLSETFKDTNSNNFDQNFKNEVEDEMKLFIDNYKDEKNPFDFINFTNLDYFLKKTKSTISSG
jgi:exonuclease III